MIGPCAWWRSPGDPWETVDLSQVVATYRWKPKEGEAWRPEDARETLCVSLKSGVNLSIRKGEEAQFIRALQAHRLG